MRILFVASEIAPWVKTGGLGDVAGALPTALAEAGAEVRVLVPAYPGIVEAFPGRRLLLAFQPHRFVDHDADQLGQSLEALLGDLCQ